MRDHVRGLLIALGAWFVLLFGVDLALLALSGAPWVQDAPGLWVALLMANPLDALRITVIFDVERAAFAGLDGGGLVAWWLAHGCGCGSRSSSCCGPPPASPPDSPAHAVASTPEDSNA